MTDVFAKRRKRKKGRNHARWPGYTQVIPELSAPPVEPSYEHDHTDGRWYSDCPACNPELAEATR